jgi:hypothetical protein
LASADIEVVVFKACAARLTCPALRGKTTGCPLSGFVSCGNSFSARGQSYIVCRVLLSTISFDVDAAEKVVVETKIKIRLDAELLSSSL